MAKPFDRLELCFSEQALTHYGGMILIQRFCNRLGLRRMIQRQLRMSQRTSGYDPVTLIMAILYAIIMGLKRVNKTEILQYNGAFLRLLGLRAFPDQTTLRRFLKRLGPKQIRRLAAMHDQLRQQLFGCPQLHTSLILDLDSVVLVVYGKQQGARFGYNPKRPGHRSYHPLLAFEARRQEFWHGSLRAGNISDPTGAVPFMARCLDKIPKAAVRSRIRLRADAGFCGRRLVEFLDEQRVGYAIVARLYRTIKTRSCSCHFQRLKNGWATGSFEYQPYRWGKPHRFVVMRRPIPTDPDEARLLTLFQHQKYAYHVLVSNLPLKPWRLWQFYMHHAAVEKNIRELLYDYPLGQIPTRDWIANVAFFHLILLAYDIVHWFKRLYLPKEYLGATLDTVRTAFLAVPARLTKQGSRNILNLPDGYHYQKQFEAAFRKLEKAEWREKAIL
jgi:hypothetical protein